MHGGGCDEPHCGARGASSVLCPNAGEGAILEVTNAAKLEIMKDAASGMPYFLQTEDWLLLSNHLCVNFVLHGIEGTTAPQATNEATSLPRLGVRWISKSTSAWGRWVPELDPHRGARVSR